MEIHDAIDAGNLNELRQAINRGANLNQSLDEDQKYPLHIAVEQGNLPIVLELLNRGARVNVQNNLLNTPLHTAIIEEINIAIVQELINRDSDLEAINDHNETPLHLAVGAWPTSRSLETTQLLLKKGANIHAVGGDYAFTPLQYAVSINDLYDDDINSEIVQELINNGADVSRLSDEGNTLLHLAAKNSAPKDTLQMFINAGVNVNAINHNEETPLHLAAESTRTNVQEAIQVLVSNNANMNALDNQNRTPLDLMALNPLESSVIFFEGMVAGQRLQAYAQADANVTTLRNEALEVVLQQHYGIAHQNRGQLQQDQNQQQLGAMIIPINQDGVAPNNGNQARGNAPEQEQQNEQNVTRIGPRR